MFLIAADPVDMFGNDDIKAARAGIRGIPADKDSISPNRHPDIASMDDLLDRIAWLRELTGKPVGIKTAIGGRYFANELCERILEMAGFQK